MSLESLIQSPLTRPREESDVDLVAEVTTIMTDLNYPLVATWVTEPGVVEAVNKNTELQRFLLNRNIRIKLGMASAQTSVERFMLEANTSIPEYLDNMKRTIVPALIIIAAELH